MNDTLFDPTPYQDPDAKIKAKRQKPITGTPEPWERPWLLLANSGGVIGFHLGQSVNNHGAFQTWCGKTGRKLTAEWTHMVRCGGCVDAYNESLGATE